MRYKQNRVEIFCRAIELQPPTNSQWVTLTRVHSSRPVYTISFSSLRPSSTYRFRVVAGNVNGISHPSPESVPVAFPDRSENRPFYLKWWFLVILALAGMLVIITVVAALIITGRNRNYQCKLRKLIFD